MMGIIRKAVNNHKSIAAAVLVSMAQVAMADGFSEVSQTATTIRNGIYTLVGILCSIGLLWQFFLAKSGRKQWVDILDSCLYIVGAGASIAFATWLFTKGGSMTF